MSEAVYTITFSDGTQMSGLKLNGNNFVSKSEVKAEDFRGKLGRVRVESSDADASSELVGEHGAMVLEQAAHYTQAVHGVEDGYYFVLRDITAEELASERVEADVEYIAMMTGVEL